MMFPQPDLGIVTIVQCRYGSSRLPGKAVKPLAGRPMLYHVLQRAKAIGFPVWLATTDTQRDDAVATLGASNGVSVYRGSEWDVLGRMVETATLAGARIVVRVTGDCPLLAPDVAREVISLYCKTGGIATNDTTCSGWPDGLDVEVFTAYDLALAERATRDPADAAQGRADREHVTPWLRRHRPHAIYRCPEDWRRLKLSVDSPEDFARVKAVFGQLEDGRMEWTATREAVGRVATTGKGA